MGDGTHPEGIVRRCAGLMCPRPEARQVIIMLARRAPVKVCRGGSGPTGAAHVANRTPAANPVVGLLGVLGPLPFIETVNMHPFTAIAAIEHLQNATIRVQKQSVFFFFFFFFAFLVKKT